MSKGQGQFILVTLVGTSSPIAVPVSRIFSIYQNNAGTNTYIRYIGAKNTDEIVESLTAVFQQQSVTLNNLNMIYVTEYGTGRNVIYFTHLIKQMVDVSGDTKIMFEDARHGNVLATQTITAIYAYQGVNKNLGMVKVTGKSDSVVRIFMTCNIKSVYPYPGVGPVTGSIINMNDGDRLIVNETPTVLYTNQPK
jgi:hypothetical protein